MSDERLTASQADDVETIQKAVHFLLGRAVMVPGAPMHGRNAGIALDSLARSLAEREQQVTQLRDLLARLRQWDHLATAADGPYWTREIGAALAASPAEPAEPSE